MILYPAIDIIDGCAVRLVKGDYSQKTVYSENPVEFALDFTDQGATHLHMVDLQGAKTGQTPNFETIASVVQESGMFVEVGGGIRSMDVIERYLDAGVERVIIGTAAVKDAQFLKQALTSFGSAIAVGVDVVDEHVAVHGWTQKTDVKLFDFCKQIQSMGVSTIICTDISKDGMLEGTNCAMYKELNSRFSLNIIASGGVSSYEDIQTLTNFNMHGAIIGKAYYEGKVDISRAVSIAGEQQHV